MAYKLIDDTDIKAWNTQYEQLTTDLAAAADNAERAKVNAKMQSLGTEVEEHLNTVGRQIRGYYDQHLSKVDNWMRLSEQTITSARQAAAIYKKSPGTGVPPQLQQAVDNLTLWEKAIGDDAREFGAAWFPYRATMANKVPDKYQTAFKTLRSKVMEDQKATTTKQTKLLGYIAEAQGLLKVAAKTTMKAGIKAGTGVQRPITEAQQDARELAEQMAAELALLRSPRGLATQPAAITTALQNAKEDAKNKAFNRTPANQIAVSGRKKTFESGVQLMRTRAASMAKVLAVKLKGFRSSELTDATVKAEIKKAQKSLKDAQADLAVTEAEAKKGLGYIATIEARWAAEKKK
jgi:hypothetical protein